jgi:hypothetical protein
MAAPRSSLSLTLGEAWSLFDALTVHRAHVLNVDAERQPALHAERVRFEAHLKALQERVAETLKRLGEAHSALGSDALLDPFTVQVFAEKARAERNAETGRVWGRGEA